MKWIFSYKRYLKVDLLNFFIPDHNVEPILSWAKSRNEIFYCVCYTFRMIYSKIKLSSQSQTCLVRRVILPFWRTFSKLNTSQAKHIWYLKKNNEWLSKLFCSVSTYVLFYIRFFFIEHDSLEMRERKVNIDLWFMMNTIDRSVIDKLNPRRRCKPCLLTESHILYEKEVTPFFI